MAARHKVAWVIRIALAGALTGFGLFLLIEAWSSPLDGNSALFTPVAFVGAILCFSAAVAIVVPGSVRVQSPRSGRPAAR